MAGAWELRNHHGSVLVGILHTDVVSMAWALGLRNLQVPGHVMPVSGMPYAHARNTICMQTLQGGYDWCFMLDSDVVPPNDAILRLQAHGKPFISGVYYRRSPPHGIPVMLKNGSWLPPQLPPNQLIEVDLVGAGCLLIRRDVLEKCPPQRPEVGQHWFDWRVDMQGILPQGECLSEDFTFCTHLRRMLGIPTLVDTSVVCRHIGYSQAGPGSLLPCEATPVT